MMSLMQDSPDGLDAAIETLIQSERAKGIEKGPELEQFVSSDTAHLLRDLQAMALATPMRDSLVSELEAELLQDPEEDAVTTSRRESISEHRINPWRWWRRAAHSFGAASLPSKLIGAAAMLLLTISIVALALGGAGHASAAEILKKASDGGSFVPAGKVRHIVTGNTSDAPGAGGWKEEVWLANGREHLLMWKPGPILLSGDPLSWGISLLVNDEAVWQFSAKQNQVDKLPYGPGVFSFSGVLPDPEVVDKLSKSPDTHIVGTETLGDRTVVVISGHVGSFIAGSPLDIAEGRARGYDKAQHDYKLWIDKSTYQVVKEQHYIIWDGVGPAGQHQETSTKQIITDELLDLNSAAPDLFTFKLPAGARLMDVTTLPTPPPVDRHTDWYQFTSKEGRFSVLMPRTPDQSSTTNEASQHMEYMLGAKQGPVAYVVRYADYPQDVIQKVGAEKWLDGERDYVVLGVPGKLMSEKHISLNGYPGRELRIQADDGKFRIVELYLVNARLYKVYAVMPNEQSVTPQIEQFLDSFDLVP